VPHRIRGVKIEKLTITIPPPQQRAEKPETQEGKSGTPIQHVVVDEIHCVDADLVNLPKDAQKDPLDWAIHDLILRSVSVDKPFHFAGTLTNAKPEGEIATEGDFGPWNLDEPGGTPVAARINSRMRISIHFQELLERYRRRENTAGNWMRSRWKARRIRRTFRWIAPENL